jgi:hypothetical protein
MAHCRHGQGARMTAHLRIPDPFGAEDVQAWFGEWVAVRDASELRLSLPGSAFLRPAGIVLLAAGIADRRERGLGTRLTTALPHGDAYRQLQRVDFFRELEVEIEEVSERHEEAGRFVPLRRILDLATARKQADDTALVLEQQLPDVGPSPLRMARFILEELGANIVQHSGSARTGFGMAQAFPELRRIELAFADAGVGFLHSLQRNPELDGRIEDEAEALQLALSRGLSGAVPGRGNMGMGLELLVKFADLLDGDLRVASGDALLLRRTLVGRERTTVVRQTPGWKGSWVCLEAALP